MLRRPLDKFADLLLTFILSFSIVYASTSSMGLAYPLYMIAGFITLFLILNTIAFINKKTIIASSIVFCIFVAAVLFYVIKMDLFWPIQDFLTRYFYWLSDFLQHGGYAITLYVHTTVALLSFVISAYTFTFVYKRFMFLFILIPGAIYFVIQWAYDFVLSLVPFYIFLFSILMCYLRFVHKQKAKKILNEYTGSAGILFLAIPVCLVIVLASSLIKANEKPIEWKWLDKKINNVYNSLSNKYDYVTFDYFSVASSGFGGQDSILGGRVKLNKTHVLSVETDKRLYLKGSSYDEYTGTKWINKSNQYLSFKNNHEFYDIDFMEMYLGLPILTRDSRYIHMKEKKNDLSRLQWSLENSFLANYFSKENVKVTYQKIKTKSIFLPIKTVLFSSDRNDLKISMDSNGSVISSTRQTKGFTYNIEVMVPNHDNSMLADAIRESQKNIYRQIRSNDKNIESIMEFYRNLSNSNYKTYLQLPDTVPQRVYSLAASLTSMYNNNYDKVKALEDYLSSEYPYNLEVRSTPRDRDFVDYFLFDLKEGYCSYYASALTILSRCIGIPARYVEGYILPPKPSSKNPRLYEVTNQQAHAWTEVYFEGYGWMSFEPTAPFRSIFYSTPQQNVEYGDNMANTPAYDDYMDIMKQYNTEDMSTSIKVDILEEEKIPYLLYITIMAGVIVLILCIFLLFNNLRTKIKIYRLMNLAPRESVLGLYKLFLSVLAIQGKEIKTDETPAEYADRIDKTLYFSPVKFSQVTGIFIKSRYSQIETSDREKQIVCEFKRQLIEETKYNLGKFKFFVYRNILGKV